MNYKLLLMNFHSVINLFINRCNNISICLKVHYGCERDSDLIQRETGTLWDPIHRQHKTCIGVLGPNVSVGTRACNTWSYLSEQKSLSPRALPQCFPNNAKVQKMFTSKYWFTRLSKTRRDRKIRMLLGCLRDWKFLSDIQETPTSEKLRSRLSMSFRYSRCPGPLLVRWDSPRSQRSLNLPFA